MALTHRDNFTNKNAPWHLFPTELLDLIIWWIPSGEVYPVLLVNKQFNSVALDERAWESRCRRDLQWDKPGPKEGLSWRNTYKSLRHLAGRTFKCSYRDKTSDREWTFIRIRLEFATGHKVKVLAS